MIDEVKIKVPATSANLGPGFDTLGVGIDLCNEAHIKRASTHQMNIYGEGENNARVLNNNIFVNIFHKFYKELTHREDTFHFTLHNKIPISRGLGSSSAVILGAIYSAHLMSGRNIHKKDLLNLALHYEKHPDNITPATFGGFCVASLRRHKVVSIHHPMPSYLRAVLVIPPKPMSTNVSRKALPTNYNKKDTAFNVAQSSLLTAAILSGKWHLLAKACGDRMHEKYRMETFPELFSIKKKLISLRPFMVTLSGSGSTMFSIFHANDVKYIKQKLYKLFPEPTKVLICKFNNDGIKRL